MTAASTSAARPSTTRTASSAPTRPGCGSSCATRRRWAQRPARQRSRAARASPHPAPAGVAVTAENPFNKAVAPRFRRPPQGYTRYVATVPTRFDRTPVDSAQTAQPAGPAHTLDAYERELLGDLFAVIEEHAGPGSPQIDRGEVERAFVFACEHHQDQRRRSGEDFITHPIAVAKICAGMRLDTATLVAALLHDTVEDTSATLDEVRTGFGDEVAQLVDGVTKLTGITFQSRDEKQAENYRKMMVAMAQDIRVVLIKLADRLHNMRTLQGMPKNKQQEKARETLDIFAPLAHRLGIHAIKWELEDLAFATLHPRKFKEIRDLVNQQRGQREEYVDRAGDYLEKELDEVGIDAH